jgi:multiple sugar transport system permease protein
VIGAFQQFDLVYVLTQGGPMDTTRTVVYTLYQDAFRSFVMGRATAEGWVLFIIILAFTLIQYRVQNRWVHYE